MSPDLPLPEKPAIVKGIVSNIVFNPVSPDLHEQAVSQVNRILAVHHHSNADDKEALWVWDIRRKLC